MADKEKSVFDTLNAINVNENKKQKNNLDYLSWAWAWTELHKIYPNATSKVYETEQGVNYWTDGKTAWVKVGVTVEGLEHIEYLPVMDFKNKSIPVNNVTSTDVNKAIQRGLTKAISRHGLGLYIYAGEDLPEEDKTPRPQLNDAELIAKYLEQHPENKPNVDEFLKTKSEHEVAEMMKAYIDWSKYWCSYWRDGW